MKDDRDAVEIGSLKLRLEVLQERVTEEMALIRARIEALERKRGDAQRVELPQRRVEPVLPPPLPQGVPASPPAQASTADWEDEEPVVRLPADQEEVPAAAKVPARSPEPVPPAATESGGSFELRFGRVWLVRIGIALLLTGLVLLGNFAYRNWIRDLPNGARLAGLFLCAFALVETGRRLARRGDLRAFGEVVMAGGLAFFYYCVFAAHHVERLRVIDSPVLAALLLAGAAGVVAAVSWLRQAKGTAMLGLVLAAYAVMLQPLGWLSCVSALLIAATGWFFVTRPGWEAPGWTSLLTSYASFAGWQLMGAAPGGAGAVALWFLPATWALFAIPCVAGRLRAAMPDRSKAWFCGVNNALFLLLFAALWVRHHGDGQLWLVLGATGAVLLALGVIGRGRPEPAGGVNVSQALACLSLALVLKLDGWHLGLSLAGESLALAAAFRRYRGLSELAFAVLTGCAGALLMSARLIEASGHAPDAWPGGVAALLVAAASWVLLTCGRRVETEMAPLPRLASTLLFVAAMMAGMAGWWLGLRDSLQPPTAVALALAMAVVFLIHGSRGLPWIESGFASLGWLATGGYAVLAMTGSPVVTAVCLPLAFACMWLWRHRVPSEVEPGPEIGHWLGAGVITLAAGFAINRLSCGALLEGLLLGGAGVMLPLLAMWTRCGALAPLGALLGIAAVFRMQFGDVPGAAGFALAGINALGFAAFAVPVLIKRMGVPLRSALGVVVRCAFFAAWVAAWVRVNPDTWGDWIALGGVAWMLGARGFGLRPPVEALASLGLGLAWWASNLAANPLPVAGSGITWHGWGVLAACLTLAFACTDRSPSTSAWRSAGIAKVAGGLLCLVCAVWLTRVTVMAEGWRPVTVSWTVLGFLFVCAGLWRAEISLRAGGFLLLGMALAKVFAVDVWEFNAFMRVVSFIVLGIALLLLGLFYHRFAPMLKRLFDGDAED